MEQLIDVSLRLKSSCFLQTQLYPSEKPSKEESLASLSLPALLELTGFGGDAMEIDLIIDWLDHIALELWQKLEEFVASVSFPP